MKDGTKGEPRYREREHSGTIVCLYVICWLNVCSPIAQWFDSILAQWHNSSWRPSDGNVDVTVLWLPFFSSHFLLPPLSLSPESPFRLRSDQKWHADRGHWMFTTFKLCTVLVPQTPDTFTGGGWGEVRAREEQDKHIDQSETQSSSLHQYRRCWCLNRQQ